MQILLLVYSQALFIPFTEIKDNKTKNFLTKAEMGTIMTMAKDLFVVPIILVTVFLPMREAEAGILVENFPAEHDKWALPDSWWHRGALTAATLVGRGDNSFSLGGETRYQLPGRDSRATIQPMVEGQDPLGQE